MIANVRTECKEASKAAAVASFKYPGVDQCGVSGRCVARRTVGEDPVGLASLGLPSCRAA